RGRGGPPGGPGAAGATGGPSGAGIPGRGGAPPARGSAGADLVLRPGRAPAPSAHRRDAFGVRGVGGDGRRAQTPWLHLRGPDDLLCADAGHRDGRRPGAGAGRRTALEATLEAGGELHCLPDRTLGVQLRGDIRATNDVDLLLRIVAGAVGLVWADGLLAGAQHNGVDRDDQLLALLADGGLQAGELLGVLGLLRLGK